MGTSYQVLGRVKKPDRMVSHLRDEQKSSMLKTGGIKGGGGIARGQCHSARAGTTPEMLSNAENRGEIPWFLPSSHLPISH